MHRQRHRLVRQRLSTRRGSQRHQDLHLPVDHHPGEWAELPHGALLAVHQPGRHLPRFVSSTPRRSRLVSTLTFKRLSVRSASHSSAFVRHSQESQWKTVWEESRPDRIITPRHPRKSQTSTSTTGESGLSSRITV